MTNVKKICHSSCRRWSVGLVTGFDNEKRCAFELRTYNEIRKRFPQLGLPSKVPEKLHSHRIERTMQYSLWEAWMYSEYHPNNKENRQMRRVIRDRTLNTLEEYYPEATSKVIGTKHITAGIEKFLKLTKTRQKKMTNADFKEYFHPYITDAIRLLDFDEKFERLVSRIPFTDVRALVRSKYYRLDKFCSRNQNPETYLSTLHDIEDEVFRNFETMSLVANLVKCFMNVETNARAQSDAKDLLEICTTQLKSFKQFFLLPFQNHQDPSVMLWSEAETNDWLSVPSRRQSFACLRMQNFATMILNHIHYRKRQRDLDQEERCAKRKKQKTTHEKFNALDPKIRRMMNSSYIGERNGDFYHQVMTFEDLEFDAQKRTTLQEQARELFGKCTQQERMFVDPGKLAAILCFPKKDGNYKRLADLFQNAKEQAERVKQWQNIVVNGDYKALLSIAIPEKQFPWQETNEKIKIYRQFPETKKNNF